MVKGVQFELAILVQKSGEVFVLDEPSSGLHDKDIVLILKLLRRLVNQGNTVIIIEHRLELIAKADWIIDLGSEGGSNGGRIVFEEIPSDIIYNDKSLTGKYLKAGM